MSMGLNIDGPECRLVPVRGTRATPPRCLSGRAEPHYLADADPFSHSWTALRTAVAELPDEDFARPSGCAGWLVRDLVCHLVIDAQDVLITLVTPAEGVIVKTCGSVAMCGICLWCRCDRVGVSGEALEEARERGVQDLGLFQVQVVAGAGDAHGHGGGSLPKHLVGFLRRDEAGLG